MNAIAVGIICFMIGNVTGGFIMGLMVSTGEYNKRVEEAELRKREKENAE